MPISKRTIKLRQADAQGREFIRVSPRNKTNWASCNFVRPVTIREPGSPPRPQYGQNSPSVSTAQGVSSGIFDAAVYVLPVFGFGLVAFATPFALPTIYALSPYQLASSATVTAASVTANPLLALGATTAAVLTTQLTLTGFLSPDIETAEFTNFNRPCNNDPGQGRF
jgi:hypothetical protein